MKINKQISIDIELAEELNKEANASKLINNLLRNFYLAGGDIEEQEIKQRIEEKIKGVKDIEEEINLLNERLESIEKKKKYLKEVFKDIPDEILTDFRLFPKITEASLSQRFNDIYKKKYKLEFTKVLEAFKEYQKE